MGIHKITFRVVEDIYTHTQTNTYSHTEFCSSGINLYPDK